MLSDINALEQFPRQIARRRRTEEISDRQSNHTRYPENHGIHLDALISGSVNESTLWFVNTTWCEFMSTCPRPSIDVVRLAQRRSCPDPQVCGGSGVSVPRAMRSRLR